MARKHTVDPEIYRTLGQAARVAAKHMDIDENCREGYIRIEGVCKREVTIKLKNDVPPFSEVKLVGYLDYDFDNQMVRILIPIDYEHQAVFNPVNWNESSP